MTPSGEPFGRIVSKARDRSLSMTAAFFKSCSPKVVTLMRVIVTLSSSSAIPSAITVREI